MTHLGTVQGNRIELEELVNRADPIVAAQAITHGLVLATGIVRYYERVTEFGYISEERFKGSREKQYYSGTIFKLMA
jgi:hypothetical protein